MEWESPDLISSLPSEVLQRITSFIPLKEAVRTSILSASWRSLWIPFQVVELEDGEKLIQVIATLLKSCNSPQLWKFCLGDAEGSEMKNDLIFLATMGGEKELHLDFSGGKQITSSFSLSSSKHSKEAASFSSLKTLHLRSVNHRAEGLVSALITHCQLLENLKIEKCIGLQKIDIKASNCLQSFLMVDCPEMVSITISAPNLKSFLYRGALPRIQLESSPQTVAVVLDLREGLGHNEFDCEDILSLLSSLQDIEILTISSWLVEWLCAAGVVFGRLQFQFDKLKELYWIGPLVDRSKLDSLACFLNMSPFLEKLVVNIDEASGLIPCPYFHQFWHEPHLGMDYGTAKSDASLLKHLEVVKFMGFTATEDELLLMDLLLKKAFTLKSMIVTSAENQSWRVAKIPYSQLHQTLRCYPKQIGISFPNKGYFFGLKEEESNGLCPANGRCL